MNLYIRYFDYETLVYSVDEALDFLCSIPEIGMTPDLEYDIRDYVASDNRYPKRYKIRQHVYFIIIKTVAETMEDFKQKKAVNAIPAPAPMEKDTTPEVQRLGDIREGWYQCGLDFKRVVMVPATGKFEYQDTYVEVQCKAVSGLDAYNRLIDYLRTRVDGRSQFPSAKGKNYHFTYLGMWK